VTNSIPESVHPFEPIYVAANVREIDFVERLLHTEAVEYAMSPDALLEESDSSRVCFLGVLFSVPAPEAARCRKLLFQTDLSRGLVASPQSSRSA
jgi:hypothetical protein